MLHSNQIQYLNPRLAALCGIHKAGIFIFTGHSIRLYREAGGFFSDGLPADVYAVFAQQVLQLFEQFGIGVYLPAALQVQLAFGSIVAVTDA